MGTYEGDVCFLPEGELLVEDPSREAPEGRGGVVLG